MMKKCACFFLTICLLLLTACDSHVLEDSLWNGYYVSDSGKVVYIVVSTKKEVYIHFISGKDFASTPLEAHIAFFDPTATELHYDQSFPNGHTYSFTMKRESDTITVEISQKNSDSIDLTDYNGVYTKYQSVSPKAFVNS